MNKLTNKAGPDVILIKLREGKKILTAKKRSHFNGVTSSPTAPVDKVWKRLLKTGIMQ